ncbi:MAG: type transport system ATP-binding protein [Gaiellales bacterium]|nr:type transport system ATP-binding protein [Gaiellales bacterium]
MTDAHAVEARGLSKVYGDLVAVGGVDLTVEQGDVYGYLGPNGAGKTTSLRMMLGLIRPTGGHVQLFGRDPQDDPVAALDGVAGFVEDPTFYPYLRGRTNLELLSALDGGVDSARIDEVLEIVELSGRARDRVGGYSHGMRQRLGIAAALLRRPQLLLLDEPTTGLDPGGMRDMRELVRNLAADGITVLLSSHLMVEVEQLCNRVAIIQLGRIRYEGSLADLLSRASGHYRLEATDADAAFTVASRVAGIRDLSRRDGALTFAAGRDEAAALTIELGRAGVGIHALVPEGASLEELFFELTEEQP